MTPTLEAHRKSQRKRFSKKELGELSDAHMGQDDED